MGGEVDESTVYLKELQSRCWLTGPQHQVFHLGLGLLQRSWNTVPAAYSRGSPRKGFSNETRPFTWFLEIFGCSIHQIQAVWVQLSTWLGHVAQELKRKR